MMPGERFSLFGALRRVPGSLTEPLSIEMKQNMKKRVELLY